MALVTGTRYIDSDTANVYPDVSNSLTMISPSEIPFLDVIRRNERAKVVGTTHSWLERSLRPLDSAVADSGDLANTTDPVTFNVTAGHGGYFRVGDLIKVENETMLVTVISTNDITVSRGYGGSTPASHAGTPAVRIISPISLTDAAVGEARTSIHALKSNYCQIYEASVKTTSTWQAIKKYVEQDDFAAQISDELKIAWMTIERTGLEGRGVAPDPSASIKGSAEGVLTTISTNAYAKSGAYLIEDYILNAIQDAWTAGGRPDTIFANSFQKRRMNQFLDSMRQTTRIDRIAGSVVDTYTCDFGTLDIVLARSMPTDTVLIIEKGRIKFGFLTDHELKVKDIPPATGLVDVSQLLAQYTFECRNENAHAKITGLATS
jgi:hypothetical protein